MNPYLENPERWPEVYHLLISLLAKTLNPQLLPKYRAAIEKRVYQLTGEDALLIGIPDATVTRFRATLSMSPSPIATSAVTTAIPTRVTLPMPLEIQEGYLEVREVATQAVITAIEVLSPTNKLTTRGRTAYEIKRQAILASPTHLVEIDLLRSGQAMSYGDNLRASQYHILVSRSPDRPQADLYGFNLVDPIPRFNLPLAEQDLEPIIDLHALLDQVYDRAGYGVVIDYQQNPIPPLNTADRAWCEQVLRSAQAI